MRVLRLLPLLLLLGLVPAVVPSRATPAPVPTLVGIRAAHHDGFDRVVFDFKGPVPARRQVRYVDQLLGSGSGLPVRIAGRAILQVRFQPTNAHDAQGHRTAPARLAFALPNVMTVVQSGDFEAETTYGIGLAKRARFQVHALRNPSRVVVDVGARFRTVNRKVFFFNRPRFVANQQPFFSPRLRPVPATTPAVGVMDRLFAGPLRSERADGLRLLLSDATGFSHLDISKRIARVRLVGGCNSHGSTVTVAGEIMPTLRQLASVRWVKILDPAGTTQRPAGRTDSVPACLEP